MDENLIKAITKAIAYTENNGEPHPDKIKAGKTGEMASIFQYTPDTWKAYSKEILGQETKLDPNTESFVTASKVKGWLEKGYKPEQILSMWNAGVGEPNAYAGKFSSGHPSKGVNAKYGVPFDVPSYVHKGMSYVNQFAKEQPQAPQGNDLSQHAQAAADTIKTIVNKYAKPQQSQQNNGLMGQLMPSV